MSNLDANLQNRSLCKTYRYKIEQTPRGALITVSGDGLEEVVADYIKLRIRLEQEGFKIAPEE